MDEVVFGRYRLIALIGEGGMGKVFKAHDTVIGRDVAVKVLPTELGAEPGYRERFRREAHTAARLTEPHIIPIHDTGEIEGQLYLVMPVIDGIDLQGLLARDGAMSPQRAVQVIEQLAAALQAAHGVGLVHRDIKPSNALVNADDFVYLIDFGIAHDAAATTRLTSTGMTVGTWAYMAPERFTTGTADARADVYALACVLYECLTGAPPFPGNSMEQQIAGHLTLDPPKPSGRCPAIGSGFDEVISAGMAKDPEQRYQSARELAAAARQALTAAATAGASPLTPPAVRAAPHPPNAGAEAARLRPVDSTWASAPTAFGATPAPPAQRIGYPQPPVHPSALPPPPTPYSGPAVAASAPPASGPPSSNSYLWVFGLAAALLVALLVAVVVLVSKGNRAPSSAAQTSSVESSINSSSYSPATTSAAPPADPEAAALVQLQQTANQDRGYVSAQLADHWIPQLSTKEPGIRDPDDPNVVWDNQRIWQEFQTSQQQYGAKLLWSRDWSSLDVPTDCNTSDPNCGYWVTVVPLVFSDSASALSWCTSQNLDDDHCYAQNLVPGATAHNPH